MAAALELGLDEIECVVLDGDGSMDEEIALAENVNRLEMHPLDEAAVFNRMVLGGKSIEEIAKYYARSPSLIYKRLRLAKLSIELKGLFRDGKLGIGGAVLLAELPEKDQAEFVKWYNKHDVDAAASDYKAVLFIQNKQRYKIKGWMSDWCDGCRNRTHNSGNSLFDEYRYLDDVCLDGDCYRRKWSIRIARAVREEIAVCREGGTGTPHEEIFFEGGIPELLYEKAAGVDLAVEDEDGNKTRFAVLSKKEWEVTNKRAGKGGDGRCWIIHEYSGGARAEIGFCKRKEQAARAGGAKGEAKQYPRELLEAIAKKQGTSVEATAGALVERKIDEYTLQNAIDELLYERVIAERIAEETPGNYIPVLLRLLESALCCRFYDGGYMENNFSDDQKKLFELVTGKKKIKDLDISADAMRLIHFLLLCMEFDMPTYNESGLGDNEFFNYSGLTKKAYGEKYLAAAADAGVELLAPKKRAVAEDVRRCRVCGCTDADCSECIEATGEPCYWVEEDLCSRCAEETGDAEGFDEADIPF